jgi:RNA polymerase sigma-70 factor, ECF subfamily
MKQTLTAGPAVGFVNDDGAQLHRPTSDQGTEVSEETGERLFRTGEYMAGPGLAQRQARFQSYVAGTRQRLYRFALHTLGNSQDAEDITQEALTRAWTHFETFDPQGSFDAWVFRITRNLMIDRNRRCRRRPEISLEASAVCLEENDGGWGGEMSLSISNPQDCLIAKESRAELMSTLNTLPSIHQATLLLVAQEYSYEQIATALNCPVGTVRSRVHRARVMVQRHLKAKVSYE